MYSIGFASRQEVPLTSFFVGFPLLVYYGGYDFFLCLLFYVFYYAYL